MDNITSFLPRRQTDVLAYGAQVHDALSSPDFDPALLQLTDADVTELGALLTDAHSTMNAVNAARMELAARTKAWSARGGAHERLVTKLRTIANTARVSDAPHSVLASIGVRRKTAKSTRRNAPSEAPEFSVDSVVPGIINIRFRVSGSAQPRARAVNTIGVQIAVVNDATPKAAGEADTAHIQFLSHSPGILDSTKMPSQVRLYARWMTRRGETGPWSLPQSVSVL